MPRLVLESETDCSKATDTFERALVQALAEVRHSVNVGLERYLERARRASLAAHRAALGGDHVPRARPGCSGGLSPHATPPPSPRRRLAAGIAVDGIVSVDETAPVPSARVTEISRSSSVPEPATGQQSWSQRTLASSIGAFGSAEDEQLPRRNSLVGAQASRRRRTKLGELIELSNRNLQDELVAKENGTCGAWWCSFFVDRETTTAWQRRQTVLDLVMGVAILLNALTIGASVEISPEWRGWTAIDFGFAVLFTVELVISCRSSGLRNFLFTRATFAWNVFDFALIIIAWFEVVYDFSSFCLSPCTRPAEAPGIPVAMRIFRLARIARVLRVCRLPVFAELLMMINGAVGGVKTFLWSQLAIALLLYVVALVLRETVGESVEQRNGSEMFSSLAMAYFTSFRCLVAGDCTTSSGQPIFVLVARHFGWGYAALYYFTTILMTFGLFNVIVAIYVENTVAAAKYNELRQKQVRLADQKAFNEKVLQLVRFVYYHVHRKTGIDIKETDMEMLRLADAKEVQLTPETFQSLLQSSAFQQILRDLDIADEEQLDLFDTLDVDGGGTIDLEELIVGIAKLRGDARRSDIISVALILRSLQDSFSCFSDSTTQQLEKQAKAIEAMTGKALCGTVYSSMRASPSAQEEAGHRTPTARSTARATARAAAKFDL